MRNKFAPTYRTKKCSDLSTEDFFNFSHLFSANYGRWSGKDNPAKKGKRIKLPMSYYEKLSHMEDMFVSYCEDDGLLIGACFFLKKPLANKQVCVWITQLVVDNSYRKRGIATRLLQSAWGFSDYHAWGLATANTVTIKTLESVTWRKVDPVIISDNLDAIRQLCESLPYKTKDMTVGNGTSVINTDFFIDREKHDAIDNIYIDMLGELPDGYEWLAFTFQTQMAHFDQKRLNEILDFSAEQLNDAYSRMDMEAQAWTKGTSQEVDVIERLLGLQPGCSILDVGCGQGRHSIELASRGYKVLGIDSSEDHLRRARAKAMAHDVDFKVWDARKRLPGTSFDNIICLYDVIGSFRTLEDNELIVKNLAGKLRKGGRAAISVMNMEHIRLRATNRGDIEADPQLLLSLKASNIMQTTGDMFNVDYQLLDEKAHLVYHKEQFEEDGLLSAEYIVADYRFTQQELMSILGKYGLRVIESRFVRAGRFDEPLPEDHDKAKEILFIVERK